MNEAIELIKYLTPAMIIAATILIMIIKGFEYFHAKLKSKESLRIIDKDIANIDKMNSIISDLTYSGQEKIRQLLNVINDGKMAHGSDIDRAIRVIKEYNHNNK